ncbi:MAG: hypothetical protein ACR2F2_11395 [Pyrinomonadaceae bacterium]
MQRSFIVAIIVFLVSSVPVFSQNIEPSPTPKRERIVADQKTSPNPTATPTPSNIVVIENTTPKPQPTPVRNPIPVDTPQKPPIIVGSSPKTAYQVNVAPAQPLPFLTMNFGQLKSKIAEAKRQMQARPIPTALTDSFLMTNVVRVAFHDWDSGKLDYVVMTKDAYLSKASDVQTISSNGKQITVRTIRGNGVNTPLMIFDENNKSHLPLLVQYPVEKGGRYIETAYYISTHPGIVNPEVVNAGAMYVRNTIDIAREKLREKGIFIQPRIADMAEKLATVEHVDHQRFRTEYHPNIYNDIFTLYALNEGQTYRYSVSSAGAGGMVQMIPPTYRMIRSRYYQIDLMPDFVEGMRDHVNASQAMLLYMQMTWNDLIASPTVFDALQNGIATDEQLMAAGYNSNPARLAGYIRRGGAGWTNLIPRETKIYLQINESLNRFVPMKPRTR